MPNQPDPLSSLAALSPTLPDIPDRLLRSRWLVSTLDYIYWTSTATTSSCNGSR